MQLLGYSTTCSHGPVSWQGGEGVVLCDFEAMHDVWNVLAELAGQEIPDRLWLDLKIPAKMGR